MLFFLEIFTTIKKFLISNKSPIFFKKDDNSSSVDEEQEARKKLYADEMRVLSQYIAILDISNEFSTHFLQVEEKDLDANLWSPCPDWRKKAWSLEGEQLKVFKAQMLSAIQEKVQENKFSEIDQTKKEVIKRIERSLQRRGVKVEELETHNRNFHEEISNSKGNDKELIDIEEGIKDDIWRKADCNGQSNERIDESSGEKRGPTVFPSRERGEQQVQQEQKWFPFWGKK